MPLGRPAVGSHGQDPWLVIPGHHGIVATAWILVAAGLFAVGFHGFHLLRGDEAFRLPISLALLAATFVLSLVQAWSLVRSRTEAA
jgi:hypothetical protein